MQSEVTPVPVLSISAQSFNAVRWIRPAHLPYETLLLWLHLPRISISAFLHSHRALRSLKAFRRAFTIRYMPTGTQTTLQQ
ncbi:MAG: hypothetical protein CM1200mP15_16180 [Dehalococcoidia bacterium]|nr:MAG: hypothetical protein CM1200mP15_16180 [Dehalococcoidia bacterium]